MKKNLLMVMAAVLFSATMFIDCNKNATESQTPYDYSVEANWMVKNDQGKAVDVFYIYPTVVMSGNSAAAAPDDDEKKAAFFFYFCQAGCMAEYANMYAPYYRQVSYDYAAKIGGGQNLVDTIRANIGKQDIFAALDYYFENINSYRPFILASHSQGSAMMRLVFEEYMNKDEAHKNYFKRMIAAYPLGFSYPKTWMTQVGIKGATGADDTGVIIAYNTEGPNPTQSSMLVTSDDYVINPLTWSTDTVKADTTANKGTLVWEDKLTLAYHIDSPGHCDAQVDPDRAALVCTTDTNYLKMEGDAFGDKSLHNDDWIGYYVNIKENAKTRIDAYFASH